MHHALTIYRGMRRCNLTWAERTHQMFVIHVRYQIEPHRDPKRHWKPSHARQPVREWAHLAVAGPEGRP